ncbi:hypothetical protein ACFWTE_04850 [Nocardiopsis sp. NPDC058631]|uniref:hypothetical protein n=1 Tax=Nocardiopsis sp. NPDC058631 TaxID=3346566 RepID=UPI00365DE399
MSSFYEAQEKISLDVSGKEFIDKTERAIREAGWKHIAKGDHCMSASHGSPRLFRYLGVFLFGSLTLPATLEIEVIDSEKSARVKYSSNEGSYYYRTIIGPAKRAYDSHWKETKRILISVG